MQPSAAPLGRAAHAELRYLAGLATLNSLDIVNSVWHALDNQEGGSVTCPT